MQQMKEAGEQASTAVFTKESLRSFHAANCLLLFEIYVSETLVSDKSSMVK